MTEYTLENGNKIYINDNQICTKVEEETTVTFKLSNGDEITVKK